jgi:hypothetical protein
MSKASEGQITVSVVDFMVQIIEQAGLEWRTFGEELCVTVECNPQRHTRLLP